MAESGSITDDRRERRDRDNFLRFRAPVNTISIFRINHMELWLLLALDEYTGIMGRKYVSRDKFFGTLSGNHRRWPRFQGYLLGLVKKGLIEEYEYKLKPGSLSIKVSELGQKAIDQYDRDYRRLCEMFPTAGEIKEASLKYQRLSA